MLKEHFQIPTLLTSYTSQDELERLFSVLRCERGGGSCMHPSALQYHQRLGQTVILLFLQNETFDIFAMQERLKAKRNTDDDVEFS